MKYEGWWHNWYEIVLDYWAKGISLDQTKERLVKELGSWDYPDSVILDMNKVFDTMMHHDAWSNE